MSEDDRVVLNWLSAKLCGLDTNKTVAAAMDITPEGRGATVARLRRVEQLPPAHDRGTAMIDKLTGQVRRRSCATERGEMLLHPDRHATAVGTPALQDPRQGEDVGEHSPTPSTSVVNGWAANATTQFREYGERWRPTIGGKDADNARYSLARVYRLVGDDRLSSIDGLTVQSTQHRLLNEQPRAGPSPYSRNSVDVTMSYFKRLLRRAHADGLIHRDPTTNIRMPRRDSLDTNGTVTANQVPTVAEALAILAGTPLRYRAGVALRARLRAARRRGARTDPVARRPGRRADHHRSAVPAWHPRLTQDVARRPDDRRPRRRGDRAAPRRQAGDGSRHADPRGRAAGCCATTTSTPSVATTLVAAGLERDRYVFHSARHFAVSSMLAQGVSPVKVAAYVGDAPETILSTYTHFLRDSPSIASSPSTSRWLRSRGWTRRIPRQVLTERRHRPGRRWW